MRYRVGVAVGPTCLDATDMDALHIGVWGQALSPAEVVPLFLGSTDDLDDLWSCHGLVLVSDGAYDEVEGGLTLSTIMEWGRRGGVLATVGASPFLLARSGARMSSAISAAIDISETLIGYTASEARLRITRAGRRLIDPARFPSSLVELNRGGARSLVLHPLSDPVETLIETDRGDAVLSTHALGDGWWVAWSAGVNRESAPVVIRAIGALMNGLFTAHPPRQPANIIDQIGVADGEFDFITVNGSGDLQLVDQDDGSRWEGSGTQHRRRFRIPAQGEPRSLGVAARGSDPADFRVVYPPARRPEARLTPPTEPTDFDDFWRERLYELGSPTSTVTISPFPEAETPTVETARVSFAGWDDLEISGVLSRPRTADWTASLLSLPGYAVGGLESHPWHLAESMTILSIDVRAVGSRAERSISAEGILTEGLGQPARCGMVGAVLDSVRAFDHLLTLTPPGAPVGVFGASQGGALALAVGALRPATTAVASAAPFLVDIRRTYREVVAEPYRELQRYAATDAARQVEALAALDYVDAAHFLARVHQPCLVVYSNEDDIAPARGLPSWFRDRADLDFRERPGGHIAPAIWPARDEIRDWLVQHTTPHAHRTP